VNPTTDMNLTTIFDCPICGLIHEDIFLAKTFNALAVITQRIAHAKGISPEQRAALHAAVRARENELLASYCLQPMS